MKTAALAVVLDIGFLVGVIVVTRLTMGLEAQIDTIGTMCTIVTIISFASPLAAMVRKLIRILLPCSLLS